MRKTEAHTDTTMAALPQLVAVLRRRLPVIVLSLVIGAAIGAVPAMQFARNGSHYQASATVALGLPSSLDSAGIAAPITAQTPAQATQTAGSASVTEYARRMLGLETLPATLGFTGNTTDNTLIVTATSRSAAAAPRVADAVARAFVAVRAATVETQIKQSVTAIEHFVAALKGSPIERNQLKSRAHNLQALLALHVSDAHVSATDTQVLKLSGPRLVPNVLMGAGLAFVIGVLLAFGIEAFDTRLRDPREITETVDQPQLATVPDALFDMSLARKLLRRPLTVWDTNGSGEAFEGLRSGLLAFNAEQELHSILITSPQRQDDGKTTVTANLAVALARSGMNVVAVDADFRQPRLARQFGLEAGLPGLTELIAGAEPRDVEHHVDIPGGTLYGYRNGRGPDTPYLTVITAGQQILEPAAQLSSRGMARVLSLLEQRYDIVLLDCAPVLAASEAVTLAGKTTGAILVVRLRRTPRAVATRAATVLEDAGGLLLGVVATGASATEVKREGYGPWPLSRTS